MTFNAIRFERRDHVAYVTLDRPDKFNALNAVMIEELRAAAAAIDADSEVRAVLLTGTGRGFCSGADLGPDEMRQAPGRSMGESVGESLRNHFNPMVRAWHSLRMPLVVAVNGVAAGAGMSLALVGDIVLAARSATFVQSFAPKLGLIPDLGSTFFLPRMVGTARTKGMALLGDAVPAAEAAQWGLIWECVEDDALMPRADSLARRVAGGPTQAYTRIKSILNRQPTATLAEQLDLEAAAQAELGDTRDFAEGLLAFRGKRAPNFTGN